MPDAYLDDFDYEIFISYAQGDNEAVGHRAEWVSKLRERLEAEIGGRIGQTPRIYFDIRDSAYNKKIEECLSVVRRSAVLLAIGSPRYIKSGWCADEAEAFFENEDAESRFFLAEYIPLLPRMQYSTTLPDNRRATFWEEDRDSRVRTPWKHTNPKYIKMIERLAQAIVHRFEAFSEADTDAVDTGRRREPAAVSAPSAATVFLAYCADDVNDNRTVLRDRLENVGITVLPDPFVRPGNTARYREAVRDGLDRAAVFVQLLGARPCRALDDLPRGDTYDQFEEALEHPHLKRFLWRSDTMNPEAVTDSAYRKILENLDVDATSIPKFAQAIEAYVAAKRSPPPPPAPSTIFISAKEVDEGYAGELFDVCLERNVEAALARRSDPEALRTQFAEADSVTFVYDKAGETWLEAQHNIYRKARAERGGAHKKPPLVIYLGPDVAPQWRPSFHTRDMRTVDVRAGWSVVPFHRILDELLAQ